MVDTSAAIEDRGGAAIGRIVVDAAGVAGGVRTDGPACERRDPAGRGRQRDLGWTTGDVVEGAWKNEARRQKVRIRRIRADGAATGPAGADPEIEGLDILLGARGQRHLIFWRDGAAGNERQPYG
jgi:hypothetical protein